MTAAAVIETLPQAKPLDSQGDDPSSAHPLVTKWAPDVALCRVLAAGTRQLHKEYTTYLSAHPAEDSDDYRRRATATELFNGFGQCIKASTGMIFSTDPTLEESAPLQFRDMWEDIDGQGTHGVVFLRRVCEDAMASGLAAILVDYPDVKALLNRQPSFGEERRYGLRPYWCHLRREQLKSWDWQRIGGKTYLSHLVIEEEVTARVGRFKVGTKQQLRVFTRSPEGSVFWAIWQKAVIQGQEKWVMVQSGLIENQDEIPVSFVVMGPQSGMLDAAPPLLDLAWVNLSHWRLLSDRRYVMHLSCVPSLVLEGFQQLKRDPDDKAGEDPNQQRMVIGPGVVIRVPKDGKAYYLEPGGTSLEATGKELQELQLRMVALGLTFMYAETRAAESAEAKRIDARAQYATLATCARALQDGAAQAMIYTGKYFELPPPNVAVRQDFTDTTLDTGMAGFLLQMNQVNTLSRRTMYDLLKRGGVLKPEFNEEEEEKRLVEEALARAALVEEDESGQPPGTKKKGEGEPPAG